MTKLLDQTRSQGTLSPFGKKGDDVYTVAVPPGEVFDSCVLTLLGKRLNAGASISTQPKPGQTGVAQVVVHWWYDGGGEIDYRIEALSRKAEAPAGVSVRVPGFLPSTHGFQFSNSAFGPRPDVVLNTPFGVLELGKASMGLCGGMAYAARDYFEARHDVPPGSTPPDAGPLFDFIVHRLFDSFDLPGGVAKYLELMHPALPDHETDMSRLGLAPHGRSWRMVVEEWPQIKKELDSGHLSPIALVCVKSLDFTQLGNNHQVLAYGYDLKGTDLSLCIYDPNRPLEDDIRLSISLDHPEASKQITYAPMNVVCFFHTRYGYVCPPGFEGGVKVKAALRAAANGRLVCADNAGASPLIANRDKAGPWETFEVRIVGSNRIALKSQANGKYVCAENAGAKPLIANRSVVGPWETFELQYLPGNHVALRAVANMRLVCAEQAGSQPLVANRDKVGPWETFEFVPL